MAAGASTERKSLLRQYKKHRSPNQHGLVLDPDDVVNPAMSKIDLENTAGTGKWRTSATNAALLVTPRRELRNNGSDLS